MKTTYRCSVCGAEDSDRTSSPPSNLICTNSKCRAGRTEEEVRAQRGMFIVDAGGYYPWGEPAPKGAIA